MRFRLPFQVSLVFATCVMLFSTAFSQETPIAGFEQPADSTDYKMTPKDAKAEIVEVGDGHALQVTLGADEAYPSVTFRGLWDLGLHTQLLADLTNISGDAIRVFTRIDSRGKVKGYVTEKVAIDPGETVTLRVALNRPAPEGLAYLDGLEGMDVSPLGAENDGRVDASNIVSIQFFANRPSRPQTFQVDHIRATGTYREPAGLPEEVAFFPFVDRFGQFRHAEWPGKVHDIDELARQVIEEEQDLVAHPAPADRDALGAWADGPTLEATGAWRTEKRDGMWWFVTPEGRLFWSLGVDVIQPTQTTRIAPGRDGWFANLPLDDPEFAGAIETKTNPRGENAGIEQKTFDFYQANMIRKFGDAWESSFADLAHRRLPSWGFNTIGLWAKGPVIDQPPMPYVHWAYYISPRVKVWGPALPKWFPDVYDPKFKENLNSYAQRLLKSYGDDPNLIGVFVDNELPWGSETTMGEIAILAKPNSPHAQAFVTYLQNTHGKDINAINTAWGTTYTDWDAFVNSNNLPESDGTTADLLAFSEQTMRIYFEAARETVRTHAPGKLYLGCRFAEHDTNPLVTRIAAEYCDVLSFNAYRESVAQWEPPADIDKPILVGEWHFGAPDRGVFGSGLVGVESQEARADAIDRYLRGAMSNPRLVGAHWFQYIDELTTGRPLDKENHQIGLVNITDRPHQETVEAFRKVAADLYIVRSEP